MAIANPVYFDLDPLCYPEALEDDDASKLFMDQYLLSAGLFAADQISPATDVVDETLRHLNGVVAPESLYVRHDSISSAAITESPLDEGSFALSSLATPSSDHILSPDSRCQEPAQRDATPQDNNSTTPQKSVPKLSGKSKQNGKKTPKRRRGRTVAMERNRLAATKSRLKHKSATDALENTCNDLEEKHLNLKAEHAELVQKTLRLKSEILRHATCGDPNIETWVTDEARSFVTQIGS